MNHYYPPDPNFWGSHYYPNQPNQPNQYNPTKGHHNVQYQMFDNDRELAQAIGAQSATKENQELLEQGRAKRFRLCHKMLGAIGSRYNHVISDFRKLNINLGEVRKVNKALFETAKSRLGQHANTIQETSNNQFNKFKRNYGSFIATRQEQHAAVKRVAPLIANVDNVLTDLRTLEAKCGEYLVENNQCLRQSETLRLELIEGQQKQAHATANLDDTNLQLHALDDSIKTHQAQLEECQGTLDKTNQHLESLTEQFRVESGKNSKLLITLGSNPDVHLICFLHNRIYGNNGNEDDVATLTGQMHGICTTISSIRDDLNNIPVYSTGESPFQIGSIEPLINQLFENSPNNPNNGMDENEYLATKLKHIISHFQTASQHLTSQLATLSNQLTQSKRECEELQHLCDESQCDYNDCNVEIETLCREHGVITTAIAAIDAFLSPTSSENENVDGTSCADRFIQLSQTNRQLIESVSQLNNEYAQQYGLTKSMTDQITGSLVHFKDELNRALIGPSMEYDSHRQRLEALIRSNTNENQDNSSNHESDQLPTLLSKLIQLKTTHLQLHEQLNIATVNFSNAGKISVEEEEEQKKRMKDGDQSEDGKDEADLDAEIQTLRDRLLCLKATKPQHTYDHNPHTPTINSLKTARAYAVSAITSQVKCYEELLDESKKKFDAVVSNTKDNKNRFNKEAQSSLNELLTTLKNRGIHSS